MQRLKSKEFENLCKFAMEDEERRGQATMTRCGVMVTMKTNNGKIEWRPIRSLPDFEGIIAPEGRQFVFDCKVCSQPSLDIQDSTFKDRQLKHLLKRDAFGAICCVLIHFNPRVLKTKREPAETFAFPVSKSHPFWEAVNRNEIKTISRAACAEYAVPVEWVTPSGKRTPRPDLLTALIQVRAFRIAAEPDTISA